MFLPLLGISTVLVLVLRYRHDGWTTAHLRNDLVAIVFLAAIARILFKIVAL